MSSNDKMWQDNLWTRSHNAWDADQTARNHGQHYIMYQAPNHRERIEMTMRSLGSQTNYDCEQYRTAKKYPDRGNKKRLMKNFARFVKNPFGYTYWHNIGYFAKANPRILHLGFGFSALTVFLHYQYMATEKTDRARWLAVSGHNAEGTSTQGGVYDYHSSPSIGIPFLFFLNMGHQQIKGSEIIVSPVRNQGYRKYFEMNQKYGLAVKKTGH